MTGTYSRYGMDQERSVAAWEAADMSKQKAVAEQEDFDHGHFVLGCHLESDGLVSVLLDEVGSS